MTKKQFDPAGLRAKTLAVRGGLNRTGFGETSEALFMTSGFVYDSAAQAEARFKGEDEGFIYSRYGNPTIAMFEERLRLLEGAEACYATSSGMAAVNVALMGQLRAGDHVVASRALFGSCHFIITQLLPRYGIDTVLVDGTDLEQWRDAITEKTKALFCESVSNPGLDIADLEAIAKIAHDHGIPFIVDATFSTPYLVRPIEFGADIVVHSLTKWMGGHGTGIGGIVVDSGKFNWANGKFALYDNPDTSYHGLRWGHDLPEPLAPLAFILRMRTVPLRNLGGCISPDNAWMFLQGIETLPLRMERHCQNAKAVAAHLDGTTGIEWVRYPGLKDDGSRGLVDKYLDGKGGSMVIFGIDGGSVAGSKFIDSLELFSHLANVGDAKSLAIHPATTTHSQMSEEAQKAGGITPELVRLSVGIEHIDDIIADIDQALAKALA